MKQEKILMNNEQARNEIINRSFELLERDRSGKGYICPICGSGTGKNGTGITENPKKRKHFTCWTGCFQNADIFDIIGKEYGLNNYTEQFAKCTELLNIHVDETFKADSAYKEKTIKAEETTTLMNTTTVSEANYNDFFLQAKANIKNTRYFEERGISAELVGRFGLGYVERCELLFGLPAVIFPTSESSYTARTVIRNVKHEDRYRKQGNQDEAMLLNIQALQGNKPVFVVEGEFDALSILEVGNEAVGLGSVNNIGKFIEYIKNNTVKCPAIFFALDKNEVGRTATQRAKQKIEQAQIQIPCFYLDDLYDECEDANELLIKDRARLRNNLQRAILPSTKHYIDSFVKSIANKDGLCIPTGFEALDKVLGGGLYEGLYIIGAISSLGKTTFALQIADNIAELGQDVLIFSLEMSRNELIGKSISRLTFKDSAGKEELPKTYREVVNGNDYKYYGEEEKEHIEQCIVKYGGYAGNLYIHEGMGDISVEEIRKTVDKHISFTGRKPVVIIDFIQILEPINEKLSDKQNMDKSVSALKRIARDYGLSVIGISSLNRTSYEKPISMESFKESGAIEYSSDILLGMQLKGVGTSDFDVNKAKQKEPREVEVVILKNRNGETGGTIPFFYYPKYNFFLEDNGNFIPASDTPFWGSH